MSKGFSERLRAGRLALGLTQAALAAEVGCSAEMLRKFEAGAKRPSPAVAERLADRLGLEGAERQAFLDASSGGRANSAAMGQPPAPTPTQPWFPRSKLQPPRPRGDLLARRRLLEPLRAALQRIPVILISAPAGAGKTTLLASLLAGPPPEQAGAEHGGRATAPSPRVAWVSLDEDDNDVARLLAVLLAAIDQLAPGASAAADSLTQALAAPEANRTAQVRRAVSALINAALEAPPAAGLLVLDDLHVLSEPAALAALEYLIEQLPAHLTLAIATRHDPPLPLPRLRARRELLELRLPELRFTAAETADLLTDCLDLPLSPDDVSELHRRTEGWAAGLSLLAASLAPLESPAERARFVAQLAHTDRYLFDYLAEEVLDRQDPFVRSFLLETAVLAELTPAGCQQLTGRADAPEILDELYRRNLFLVQLQAGPGAGQATYRYHDLFRAFLLERLRRGAPEWLRELHRRAASAAGDQLRAIEHLLQAELWEEAIAGIMAISEGLLAGGAHQTLRHLIEALPLPHLAAHPRLRHLLGVCAWLRREHGVAVGLLETAAADLGRAGDVIGQGEALVFLAAALADEGELSRAAAVTERALALPLAAARRAQLLVGRAGQSLLAGALPQAASDLDESLGIVERTGDAGAAQALAAAMSGALVALPGALVRVERLSKLAAGRTGANERGLRAAAAAMRAWVALWLDRWDDAAAEARSAAELGADLVSFEATGAELELMLAVRAALAGEPELADAAFARLAGRDSGAGRLTLLHQKGRVRWLQGRHDELRAAYQQMVAALPAGERRGDAALCQEIGGLLRLADGDAGGAIVALRPLADDQARLALAPTLGDPRLHLAYAYLQAGQPEEAHAAAGRALAAIRREGMPGRLRWQGPAVAAPVLRLCAEGGPHAEFAAEMLVRLEG